MPSESRKLDTLPVEIIRRIAAHGPCQSALALLKVNRALHHACNDQLVFKSIINNGNGPSREMPAWYCTALALQSPVSSWARYALADSILAHMPISFAGHHGDEHAQEVYWSNDNFLKKGGPQLMALHHPLIDYVNARAIQAGLNMINDNRACYAQALSFCLATRVMSHGFPETEQHLAPSSRTVLMSRSLSTEERIRILRHPLYNSFEAQSISAHSPEIVALKHTIANRAVGVFSFDLRCALLGNRVHNFGNLNARPVSRTLLQPPTTTEFPFLAFMNLPLPFSPNAIENFGTCHLSTMTSPAFLEDGEWAGYYCSSIPRTDNVHFDPPMTGIRFMTSRHANDPRKSGLSADGIDGIGAFHLQGEIDSDTGRILMRKQYNVGRGWGWDWFSMMTPFGIVGSWGSSASGGWFWLWKTKWQDGDQGSI